jgi:AcrR family transcriptional regulator
VTQGSGAVVAPRRQLLAPDARRAAIIEATLPLLAEHGPAATSAQIAKAAGISQGTIFHVFEDKQHLIDAAVRHLMDIEPLLADIEALRDEPSLRRRLAACADLLNGHLVRAMPVIMKCGMPDGHDAKGDMARRAQASIASLLEPDARSLTRPVGELGGMFFFLSVAAAQLAAMGEAAMPSGDDLATLFLDGARRRREQDSEIHESARQSTQLT